jgi:hypothetical protein
LLLTKEDEFNSDLYQSKFVDNRWTPSIPVKGIDINTKYWESHGSFSKDGKLLYFTSNRKGGIGDEDIYVSKQLDNGEWGAPRNLGKNINTSLNEDTPFITEDGKTLYFSSQGFTNMGGYDIFVSHFEGDTAWSLPENMGYPFSTTDDDLFYFPAENGRIGYLSRIMSDGNGGMDIYKVGEKEALSEPIAEIPALTEEKLPPQQLMDTAKKAVIAVETKEATPIKEVIELTPAEKPKEETKAVIPIAEVNVEAKPATEVRTIEISPVLFEFDKSNLSVAGKAELDKIVELINDNPKMEVVISGLDRKSTRLNSSH